MKQLSGIFALTALVAAALITGCEDERSCRTSVDCFADESCVGGTCLTDEDGQRRDASDSDDQPDMSGEDAEADTGDPGEVVSCIEDPITAPSCTDEYEGDTNNDSSIDGYTLEFESAGCRTSGEFTGGEASLTATQCWDEHEDWYRFQIFECRDFQFRVQVDVKPAKNCETPVELRGLNCDSENTRCETLEDGTLRMTKVYERSSVPSIGVASFGVISTVDNQQVDYSMSVKVYR